MELLESSIFELSPIPMWLEDYSETKKQLDIWRSEGITDLKKFLLEDLTRVTLCAHKIKILGVNQQTLTLFEARSLKHLTQNLNVIFQQEMFESHIVELSALWEGKTEFSNTAVNHTLSGKRLDIKLRAIVLPGHEENYDRLLITTENITDYINANRLEEKNRLLAEARFDYSPTSLWVEDFSRVKNRMDYLKKIGIDDFRTFLDVHQDFVSQCIDDIILVDVNQATLDLFKASNKDELFKNLSKVFSKEMHQTFKEQLIELWNGKIHHNREAVNYALDGTIRHVLLQFTVFPGYEHNWGMVQLALTDITARKKAENYLEYLGTHDVLTKLHNRAFFNDELNRLEKSLTRPVGAIFIDMNGLKKINDQLGHDIGDELLRRMGNILNRTIANTGFTASRIGGDEFVILLKGVDERTLQATISTIQELLNIDNQYYVMHRMSISIGHALTNANESIKNMLKRADQEMYRKKKTYYNDLRSEEYLINKHA